MMKCIQNKKTMKILFLFILMGFLDARIKTVSVKCES